MTKFFPVSTNINIVLLAIVLMSIMNVSCASSDKLANRQMAADDNDDDEALQDERRTYDFNRLRHFLLTANAEQRAAKREQQELYKRELIREYLGSMSDSNPDRFQEIKKRFKTYCNSYEDLMNSNWAACG